MLQLEVTHRRISGQHKLTLIEWEEGHIVGWIWKPSESGRQWRDDEYD